jgi:hypothetical protein
LKGIGKTPTHFLTHRDWQTLMMRRGLGYQPFFRGEEKQKKQRKEKEKCKR